MNVKILKYIMLLAVASVITIETYSQTENPILPGFYPDPSICRVGEDYYLVNSSFSFFPGVPIFHSTDLSHWKQIGHILDRPSQLNLTNQWISAGIYAPSIRYHKGTFYMITTLMPDGGNFFVTAKNPVGPWTEPTWLHDIKGIDPSFFFDNDGKAYIVNNGPVADGKPLYDGHRSLWVQEFNLDTQKPVGKRVEIVNGGTDISKKPIWIEGPHIFNKDGYYYLLCAEGGTSLGHSQVIFRSKSIWGPYEVFPGNPILTQRDMPEDRDNPVTCTGHADFVQTPNGDWVAIFLGCQPYEGEFFNTGRQTFIQNVDWKGEWPIILKKGATVPDNVTLPLKPKAGAISFREYSAKWRDDFNDPKLNLDWNFIRTPKETWYNIDHDALSINARPISIDEVGNPSFIGRRLQFAKSEFSASVSLEKGKDMEAGIVAFQNEKFFYKMVVEQFGKKNYLKVSSATTEFAKVELPNYTPGSPVFLKMKMLNNKFECAFSFDEKAWNSIAGELDGKHLSTKVSGGYIGAYFGLYSYAKAPAKAKFDWAKYLKL